MRHFLYILLIAVLFMFSCKGTPKPPTPEEQDKIRKEKELEITRQADEKVVLLINQAKYTNSDFKKFIKSQYPDLSSQPGNNGIYLKLFDLFLEQNILLYQASRERVHIDSEETADYMGKMKISPEKFDKKAFETTAKIQKYLYNKIYKDIKVTNREIRNYYQKNPNEFRKKDEVQLYQILLKDKDRAEEIRGTLINYPSRFGVLAKSESKAQGVKEDGLMGYFEKGTLPKNMEEVIFSLKVGEISPIVESPYGYHIFRVTRKKRGRLLYQSKVNGEIKDKLMAEKYRLVYQTLLEDLKNELNIITYKKNLRIVNRDIKGDIPNEI